MRRVVLALLSLALLTAPAAARAGTFDRIFKEYQRTGRIDPCKYSEGDLKSAQGSVPNDVQAYAPDFPNALQAAIEQRAGGSCAPGRQQPAPAAPATSPTTTAPAAATPGASTTPAPAAEPVPAAVAADQAIARNAATARSSDAGTPAPVVALAAVGALLALGGLAYGLAHWLAWDPRWLRATRHAFAEAGWRAGNTWSEFADWVRLGR